MIFIVFMLWTQVKIIFVGYYAYFQTGEAEKKPDHGGNRTYDLCNANPMHGNALLVVEPRSQSRCPGLRCQGNFICDHDFYYVLVLSLFYFQECTYNKNKIVFR